MKVSDLKNSKYLKKEDCGENGILVTIERIEHENVAKEGAPEDMKYVMYFTECEKGTVLNSTNGQTIAKIFGSEESDAWIGKRIVLFHDPLVSWAGKLVGGIRVRAPKLNKAKTAAPAPAAPVAKPAPAADPAEAVTGEEHPETEGDDSLPF